MHAYAWRTGISRFKCVHLYASILPFLLKLNIIIGRGVLHVLKKLIYNVEPFVNDLLLRKHAIGKHELGDFNVSFSQLVFLIGLLTRPCQVFHIILIKILSEHKNQTDYLPLYTFS